MVEVWNGPWTGRRPGRRRRTGTRCCAAAVRPGVGNSDSHVDSQEVGLAQTVVRLPTLSTAEVIAAIRRGHAWVAESAGVELSFEATLGDRTVSCGDQLGAEPADLVDVRLDGLRCPRLGRADPRACRGAGRRGGRRRRAGERHGFGARRDRAVRPRRDPPARRRRGSPVDDMPAAQMVALTNPIFLT